ncbi:MAG: tRNA (adenosine(37)-N6)-threonylcarbamoyltransferase complex dimerization subunit type 1 TsaB [Pyrinomonadaceae bacterium]
MDNLPVILSLETATLGGSIFLARGTNALASRNGDPGVSHSNSLLADINESLNDAGLKLADVELFACASGPGSFTGLRIGLATIKGLAATLHRPCAGVPTLNAVAHSAGNSNATVGLLPAGRGEVFAQMFSVAGDVVIELDSAAHLSPQRLIERYGEFPSLVWAGPGADVHRALLQEHAEQHGIKFVTPSAVSDVTQNCWRLAPPTTNVAEDVSVLALRLFSLGQLQDAESLKAIYVRPSDAEIKQPWQ